MAKRCGECKGTGMDPAERDRNAVACPDCAGTGSAMRTFSMEVVRYYSVTLRAKNSRDAIRRTNAGEGDLDDSDASYVATGKVHLVRGLSMNPDAMLDGFLRHLRVERGLSGNTCLSYGYQLGAYVAFLRDRGKEPAMAMRDDILAYLERRKADGLRSASLFIAAMAVRQFHRYLVEVGRAPADPTGGMRLPRFKQRIPTPVDAEGMDRLLRPPVGAKFSAVRDHAMLELMYATGMRVSELTGLRLGQVDLREGWVRVLGKGSKERFIPFGPRAAAAVSSYLVARTTRFPAAEDIVFLNARGRRLTRGGFGRRLALTARRAGLSGHLTPHQLRHGCATALLEGGANIRVVQEILGHASLLTTQTYTHVSADLMRETCRKSHPRF